MRSMILKCLGVGAVCGLLCVAGASCDGGGVEKSSEDSGGLPDGDSASLDIQSETFSDSTAAPDTVDVAPPDPDSIPIDIAEGDVCLEVCGDGICVGPCESMESCPVDCAPHGDGICQPGETPCTSPIDCCGTCGDGICMTVSADDGTVCCNETIHTCPQDCMVACGDAVCSPGEDPCDCPVDCCGTCGDGVCAEYVVDGEICCNEGTTCPEDCAGPVCGNGVCEPGETPLSCPQDCEHFVCGNGACEPGEEADGEDPCPVDCAPACGDCVCDDGEAFDTCPIDCGFCGDGVCSPCAVLNEDGETCPADC